MLAKNLEADIEGRKELMLQVKTLYLRYQFNDRDEKFFLKSSIPALYAIWEGFIQSTFQNYLREINKLNLSLSDLSGQVLVLCIENNFKQFIEYPKKHSKKVDFFEKLIYFIKNNSAHMLETVDTKSNVGFDIMNELLHLFCLRPISEYEKGFHYSLKQELDLFLLKNRNAIAHGQDSYIDINRSDLDKAINLINFLMDCVHERIIDGFTKQTFLKKNNSAA